MKTAQHTPGPWHTVDHKSGTFEILGDDTYPVLRIRGGMTPTNSNARLIAAAPDLLAALNGLLYGIIPTEDSQADAEVKAYWCAQARAAIAKATGQGGA